MYYYVIQQILAKGHTGYNDMLKLERGINMCIWKLLSYGKFQCIAWKIFTNISEEYYTSIFRAENSSVLNLESTGSY
jgi:hypothetical protein